jgi:hypothetical protein
MQGGGPVVVMCLFPEASDSDLDFVYLTRAETQIQIQNSDCHGQKESQAKRMRTLLLPNKSLW